MNKNLGLTPIYLFTMIFEGECINIEFNFYNEDAVMRMIKRLKENGIVRLCIGMVEVANAPIVNGKVGRFEFYDQ